MAALASLRVESLLGIMARQRDNFIFWESARNPLSPGSVNLGDTPEAEASPNGATDDFVRQISILPVIRHVVSTTFFHEFRLRVFGTLLQPIDDDTGERKSVQEGTLGARYGGEWQGTWIPRAERRITAGISRDALTTKSSFFVTTDGDAIGGQPEQAAFLHLEEAILDDWQLVAGLRYDHYRIDTSESEARLSPKISLAWTGLLNNTFRFALGDGFRVPSFAERFTDNRDYLPIIRIWGTPSGDQPECRSGLARRDSRTRTRGILLGYYRLPQRLSTVHRATVGPREASISVHKPR